MKKIIEEINHALSQDSIANTLCDIAFSLVGNERGVCNLYLFDEQTRFLSLFNTRKEDKKLIIKAKQGDIFDLWVVRHLSPLFVEDAKKDFRFDLERLQQYDSRPISSLISTPLVTENRFLGLLRLDSPQLNAYAQDDLRFLVTISDLGAVALENSKLFKKTQELAIHDELTSFYTKGHFLERLRDEFKRSMRRGLTLSLLMLDIDFFKRYNDTFGHTAGDIVLKELSLAIKASLKDFNHLACRFGGEEFCILLSGLEKQKACAFAQGLCKKIEGAQITLRRQETGVTISIGVANFPLDANDADELIFKADRAMYTAKQQGRNRVVAL